MIRTFLFAPDTSVSDSSRPWQCDPHGFRRVGRLVCRHWNEVLGSHRAFEVWNFAEISSSAAWSKFISGEPTAVVDPAVSSRQRLYHIEFNINDLDAAEINKLTNTKAALHRIRSIGIQGGVKGANIFPVIDHVLRAVIRYQGTEDQRDLNVENLELYRDQNWFRSSTMRLIPESLNALKSLT